MASFWNKLGSFMFGSPASKENLYDPEQMQLLRNLIQQAQAGPQSRQTFQRGEDWINRMLSNEPGAYEAFEAPYMQQFQQEILPGIANQYGAMGSGGNFSSSSFRNALGGAAANLQTQLAALRGQLQREALPYALQYAQAPFETLNALGSTALQRSSFQRKEGSEGMLPNLLAAIGSGFAGPFGGYLGKTAGSAFSNLFQNKPTKPKASPSLGWGGGGLYPTQGNYNPYTDEMS